MNQTSEPILKRDLVGGLENGLAVIQAFDEAHPRLSLSQVAEITGLTRAAARRYLLTLASLGFAEHDGKYFVLTPKILRLGYAYLSSVSLPTRVQPFLERISEDLRESSSAAMLDGDDIVYIARGSIRRVMSIGLSAGSRLPAYCTSLGRVLLAYEPPARLDAYFRTAVLKRLTPQTKTSESDVRQAIAAVRTDGFAMIDEELEIGLRSIAVPVFDGRGKIVCAINIGAQTGRMSVEQLREKALPALQRACADLKRLL